MNRKGFTLVEVILVIVITALLLLILVPNVFVLLEKNKEKSCNSLINNIESAAKTYVSFNKYDLKFGCNAPQNNKEIKIETLINSGDLTLDKTEKIINPVKDTILFDKNDEQYNDKIKINVTYNCTTREFIYDVTGIDCTKE